ncbi:unnamed protein product [Wickerhamomyces anomalus]
MKLVWVKVKVLLIIGWLEFQQGKLFLRLLVKIYMNKLLEKLFRKAATKLPGLYEFIKVDTPVRVGLKHFIPKEEKINYFTEEKKNPSKVYLNKQQANDDIYKLYKNR